MYSAFLADLMAVSHSRLFYQIVICGYRFSQPETHMDTAVETIRILANDAYYMLAVLGIALALIIVGATLLIRRY